MRFFLFAVSLLCTPLPSPSTATQEAATRWMDRRRPGSLASPLSLKIVTILRKDPETDWSTVNIAALRQHLVDMDLLTTAAEVSKIADPKGACFEISGTGRVLEAIRAMVPAHAPFLATETGWDVSTEEIGNGVALIVMEMKHKFRRLASSA